MKPSRWIPLRIGRFRGLGIAICLVLASCSSPPTLDSVGGVVLEFGVDEAAGNQPPSKDALARAVEVIRLRLDPSGIKGVTVRITDQGRLEVGLPGANANERRQALEMVNRLGTLEFAVVANPRDHGSLIEAAQRSPEEKDDVEVEGVVVAVWHPVQVGPDGKPTELSGLTARQVWRDGNKVQQSLVVRESDDERVTGQYLQSVRAGLDDAGNACVNVSFNKEGAERTLLLTRRNSPAADGFKRQLAIIFDGRIYSVPNINSWFSNDCQITGAFSPEELQSLVTLLNAGVLEVPFKPTPVSERVIEPKKAASGESATGRQG
jgi:preprotein translocase subunit SecD